MLNVPDKFLIELAPDELDESSETKNHRLPVIWIGLGVFCAAILAGAVILDGKMKSSRANEEVASKVREATLAADRKQWDDSQRILRQALGIARATKLDDAQLLLSRVDEARANEAVVLKLHEARKASDQQQYEKAVGLLKEAIATEKATKLDEARGLLTSLNEIMSKQEADRLASQEQEKKQALAFDEAKRVLLESLDSVGGTSEQNVKKGILLLDQHLALLSHLNQSEFGLLMEHAKLAISDEAAFKFLQLIDDFQRRQFAGEVDALSRDEMVIVKQSLLEELSQGFSKRFKTKIAGKGGEEPSIFVCGHSWQGGGKFCNSIETAFYDTVARNAKHAIAQIAERKRKDVQEKEKQVVLQNGTAEFKLITEYPEKYEFGHFYFEGMFGSSYGNMKRDKDAKCYSVAFRCRQKQIFPASFGLSKDEMTFVVLDEMGKKLLNLRDSEFFARIFCRIRYGNPDQKTFPYALIYKIEFFENGNFQGQPKVTVD